MHRRPFKRQTGQWTCAALDDAIATNVPPSDDAARADRAHAKAELIDSSEVRPRMKYELKCDAPGAILVSQ